MSTVLITGASGVIGSELIPKLASQGFNVRVLSRSRKSISNAEVFLWDISKDYIEEGALDQVDHIIHLAGYTVSKRWTKERKKKILESRIGGIALLQRQLNGRPVRTFISASGISIYGTLTSETIFDESWEFEKNHNDFLQDVTLQWESAARQFEANRTVILRTPVVLSRTGGALEKMIPPIKWGIGSALGNGKQWVPWVHIDDIVNAYIHAIVTSDFQGTYNICAPEHVTNKDLSRCIARTLKKPFWAPNVPSFILKMMFGPMSSIVLEGSRVDGSKITSYGMSYQHASLESALQDLLG